MTFVPCPECGYDVSVRKLKEGDSLTTQCQNCFMDLIAFVESGDIRTQPLNTDSHNSGDDYSEYYGEDEEE